MNSWGFNHQIPGLSSVSKDFVKKKEQNTSKNTLSTSSTINKKTRNICNTSNWNKIIWDESIYFFETFSVTFNGFIITYLTVVSFHNKHDTNTIAVEIENVSEKWYRYKCVSLNKETVDIYRTLSGAWAIKPLTSWLIHLFRYWAFLGEISHVQKPLW